MNDISVTSDWNSFKHSSLDSSHRGESNGSCFISNRSILMEITIFLKMSGRVGSGQMIDPTRVFRVNPTGTRPDLTRFGALSGTHRQISKYTLMPLIVTTAF